MTTAIRKYRLVTRSDFDGLMCGVLLKHLDMIDEIKFVHRKDMQDGKVALSERDVTTNLPYMPGVYLAFDHHLSEAAHAGSGRPNHVIHPEAPSAARVVYDYYGGKKAFPTAWANMMAAVDKGDAAQFNREEILHPQKWELLNFLTDARTGLGRFRNFRISNYRLMMDMIDYCKNCTIDQIMALPDVKERVDLYFEHEEKFKAQLKRCAVMCRNLAVLDLRNEEVIYAGNRFMIYALFPETKFSIHVLRGLRNQNTVLAVGKSILNRKADLNVGELMLQYGGSGHENAGTCQIENDKAAEVLQSLIATINADR
jgi:nanoRNase/pAp phosphatase (c-di-AMP/oligoRNAs hydrolase)